MQANHQKATRSYKVDFFLTFLRADNPVPNERTRVMKLRSAVEDDKLVDYFREELRNNIAGINEFSIEDIGIEIVSVNEIPNCC